MNHSGKLSVSAGALALALSSPLLLAVGVPQDALKARAKVMEIDARATALAKIPGATVQSAELEIEHEKLVWSFDLIDAKANVIEVQVDAKIGPIVSTKAESPAEQAKEAKADKSKGLSN